MLSPGQQPTQSAASVMRSAWASVAGHAVLAALEAGLAHEVAREQQPRVDAALEQELLQRAGGGRPRRRAA